MILVPTSICTRASGPSPFARRLALWIARKLGHLLAVGGVFKKFVRWSHCAVSLGGLEHNQEIGRKVPFGLIIFDQARGRALDPTRKAAPLSAFGLTPIWVRFTPTFDI